MCFFIHETLNKPVCLDEDLIVYKLLGTPKFDIPLEDINEGTMLYAPIRSTTYYLNQLKQAEDYLGNKVSDLLKDVQASHGYLRYGIHSCVTGYRAESYSIFGYCIIFECIIPKGTPVMMSPFGDVISTHLLVSKPLYKMSSDPSGFINSNACAELRDAIVKLQEKIAAKFKEQVTNHSE